ncbi:MAG: hypothetical protein EXR72_21120 [Myxococcales bacterium]|nr:hypothetical protein [Myxococcales bacterium]
MPSLRTGRLRLRLRLRLRDEQEPARGPPPLLSTPAAPGGAGPLKARAGSGIYLRGRSPRCCLARGRVVPSRSRRFRRFSVVRIAPWVVAALFVGGVHDASALPKKKGGAGKAAAKAVGKAAPAAPVAVKKSPVKPAPAVKEVAKGAPAPAVAPVQPGASTPAPSGAHAVAVPTASNWEELSREASQPATTEALARDLEPLYAQCGKESELARRQCETIRAWHLERIKRTRYVALADAGALQVSPYDATEKNVTLTVSGCLDCGRPFQLGGGPRLLATKAPKGISEGVPLGLDVGDHEVALPDAKKAKNFADKVLPRLRVEFVFTVGESFDVGKAPALVKGLTIVPLGHRVYNGCTGEVLASSPKSLKARTMPAAERDPSCPAFDAPTEEEQAEAAEQAQLPDTLARADIERAMAPVQQRVLECAQEFELKGVARVQFTVTDDGKMTALKVLPPFEKGEAKICLSQSLKSAVFPKFKKSKPIPVEYPFVLHQ